MRWKVLAPLVFMAACSSRSGLLQGEELIPDGTLPPPTGQARPDAACPDSGCDAGVSDAKPLPAYDGAPRPSNACETARNVGTLSGDTAGASLVANGTCSEWLELRVTEDGSGVFGTPMKVTFTLTPSGQDFDLFAYVDPGKDQRSCSLPYGRSETSGLVPEYLPVTWGEGTVSNGSDDGRTVAVVVLAAKTCVAADWSLTAVGNR